ncbi:MAG: hypothetical protein IT434_19100, partial [Phycisphaerales bacterium]|nr:hypothetical protein [Phycisphaerales bacterium]
MSIAGKLGLALLISGLLAAALPAQPTVIVVLGAAGEAEYAPDLEQQRKAWTEVAAKAGAKWIAIGGGPAEGPLTDRDRLQQALAAEEKAGLADLWL